MAGLYQLPPIETIRSWPDNHSLGAPIETPAPAADLAPDGVGEIVEVAHEGVQAALSPSIFVGEGQIADLADSKLGNLEPQMIFEELNNPERFTGRSFEDIIASYFTFTDLEVSAMQEQYPKLSRFHQHARRQLACECLFRHNNQTLPRQIITTYLHAFAAKKLRDHQYYLPLTGTALDIAIDDFDRATDEITHFLRGHNAILEPLRGEFANIKKSYIGKLEKKS